MLPTITPQDLNFSKPAQSTRIVVAMSGGVDSSVTAAMLHEAGFDVVGITLQLYDQGEMAKRKGACCAGQDIYDAKNVADTLGFPHYVLDYESAFKQAVVDDFADSYLRGETPLPCVRCNQRVKFRDLLTMARDLGGDALATGHYVRCLIGPNGHPELHRAVDPQKDQSYFLFATTQEQLAYLRFPLGGYTKETTRRLAQKFNLPVADKPDSQDICFVPNGNYASIVQKLRPQSLEPGPIVSLDGDVVGTHTGIINFTVGQRKGLGIGGSTPNGEPLYVVALRPDTREVVVGPRAALGQKTIYLKEVNWLRDTLPTDGSVSCSVKIRSTTAPVPARVTLIPTQGDHGAHAQVVLDSPEYGVSAGQACVMYDGERVLGGGWIKQNP